MSQTVSLIAESRSEVGKGPSRRLRRFADKIPAIVYGAGGPEMIMIEHRLILKISENETFYSQPIHLIIDGKVTKVILKDLQRHPYKPKFQHLDFLRISEDKKLSMKVPLHFTNAEKAPGVKAGGVVTHLVIDVEVSCLPAHLPEYIEVDLSSLEMDAAIHLSDLAPPEHVEFVTHSTDQTLVNIHIPRSITASSSDDAEVTDASNEESK